MPFASGEQIGPYQIIEQLGAGGMATVYKAYQPQLDRYVAIKVLHTVLKEADPTFRERFDREAKIVAKLEHPNIVPIYDFAYHRDDPYLVMRYVEGQTLKARMDSAPLSREQMTYVAVSVASALAYAHRNDVLHRDVKPSNILLDREGKVYLADFGLARIASSGESTLSQDMMLGTPSYISPEQAQGSRDLTNRTDIYSLGVVLYEMCVGRVPYIADTPYAIIHNHIYAPLPMPRQLNPNVPPDVERVLLKALAKNPSDRFETADQLGMAFAQAIRNAGAPRPAQLSAPLAAPNMAPPARRPITRAQPRPDAAPTPPVMQTPAQQSMAAVPSPAPAQAFPSTDPQMQAAKRRSGGGNALLAALGVAALIVIGLLAVALTQGRLPSWAYTETASVGGTRAARTQLAISGGPTERPPRTLPPTWTPPPPTATGFVPTRAPDPTSTPRLRIVRTAIASRPTGVSSGDSLDLLKPEFLNKASAATLRPLILSDPTDPIPHYALAIVYYRNREEAKAEAELRRGLSLSKNDTTLLQKVAESVRAINTRGEASLTRLYVILEGQQYVLLPNNSAQKNIVGAALFALALEAERNEAAVNNLAAAAEFTNQAAVYALYALSEEKSGNGMQAEFTIRKAFGLDRDSPEVQLVRGIMADDTEEARSLLTSAANSPVRWVVEAAQRLLKGL
jgi:predicted Ser/Thr protein kinase/Flp pilus assembly protein TadD